MKRKSGDFCDDREFASRFSNPSVYVFLFARIGDCMYMGVEYRNKIREDVRIVYLEISRA